MKKVYMIIGAVVVIIAAVTFSLVNWNTKIDKTQEAAKEKIAVVKKTKPNLTGDAPASSNNGAASSDGQGQENSSSSGSQPGNGTIDNSGTQNGQNSHVETSGVDGEQTIPGTSLAEIKTAYQEVFTELEVQENSKLDQVIVQAKADFVSNKYSKEELVEKYQEVAELLESNADKTFNSYYKQLQIDLERYGHDVNEAVPFNNEYQAKKQERITHVISELSQF